MMLRTSDTKRFKSLGFNIQTLMNVFAIKMAGVHFLDLRYCVADRNLPAVGRVVGICVRSGIVGVISGWPWIALVFPLWTIVVSIQILIVGRE